MSFETVAVGPILSGTADLPAGEIAEVATADVVGATVVSTAMEATERVPVEVLNVVLTHIAQRSVAM